MLVAGGLSTTGATLSSAEVYTPRTGAWRVTPPMRTARASHTATLLPTRRVLVAGGVSGKADRVLASAEVYDPHSGRWARTGAIRATRAGHTATLVPTGRVLVTGGEDTQGANFNSTELYEAWS